MHYCVPFVQKTQVGSAYQHLPPLVFGAAALSTIYNDQDTLETPTPFRAVRLALRYRGPSHLPNSFDAVS